MNTDETQESIETSCLDEIEIRLGKNRKAKIEIYRNTIGLELEKICKPGIFKSNDYDDSQYIYLELTKTQAKSLMNLLTVALNIQEKG